MSQTKKIVNGLFIFALLIQTCHYVEHIAQVYQRWWLGMGPQQAHGILFFLDVEWNHFLFNAVYFSLLGVVVFFMLFHPQYYGLKQGRSGRLGVKALVIGSVIQGYHVVEHTVRMGQLFQFGCTPCPGILGWWLDLAYLHFVLNSVALLLPVALFPALWQERRSKLSEAGLNRVETESGSVVSPYLKGRAGLAETRGARRGETFYREARWR